MGSALGRSFTERGITVLTNSTGEAIARTNALW